ncbi:DUF3048 domain-containing protein [Ruminococcaceae bacterium OttesenSCG-928-N02]|nr:DUF3048 domain-containing protein [Ruminococcaceae bacterium OttesenSCG-928-N02]
MKKSLSLLLALIMAMGLFAACGSGNGGEVPPENSGDSSVVDPPVAELNINLLTGEEAAPGYDSSLRPTAIMINNIFPSRPQSGIGDAQVMYEMVTEGGITRIMCVFDNYENIPTVGPIRSARDQMVQLMMPMGMMYLHIGESIYARQMLDNYGWKIHEIDFKHHSSYLWFDSARHNSGVNTEHCWYLTGEAISNAIAATGVITEQDYEMPLFNFVPYNEPARELQDGESTEIFIRFSQGYHSTLTYENGRYYKSQSKTGAQIDANTGEQVSFDNVFVLFTTIEQYPNTPLSQVHFEFGGVGYYFHGGRYERVRWIKGTATDPLRIVDIGGNEIDVLVNTGTSYVAVVSLDEAEAFTY